MLKVRRGDVIDVDLSGARGREKSNDNKAGSRPCVVIQNDGDNDIESCVVVQNERGNEVSPLTIVVPLTDAKDRKRIHTHVFVAGDKLGPNCIDSLICCETIWTIDRSVRVKGARGKVPADIMLEVDKKLRLSLQL